MGSKFELLADMTASVNADGKITDETRAGLRRQFLSVLAERDDMSDSEKTECIARFEKDMGKVTNAYALSAKNCFESLSVISGQLEVLHQGIIPIAMYLSRKDAHGAAHAFGLGEAYNAVRLAEACIGKAAEKVRATVACCFPGTLEEEEDEHEDEETPKPEPLAAQRDAAKGVN